GNQVDQRVDRGLSLLEGYDDSQISLLVTRDKASIETVCWTGKAVPPQRVASLAGMAGRMQGSHAARRRSVRGSWGTGGARAPADCRAGAVLQRGGGDRPRGGGFSRLACRRRRLRLGPRI